MSETDLLSLADEIAQAAGREILAVYNNHSEIDVTVKDDNSPLTEADRRAHGVIVERLAAGTPDIPVLSEESAQAAFDARRSWTRFWLVDPLDGTKEFIKRNGEFTVNIALIDANRPVLGVVHVPVTGVTYLGESGKGARKREADGRLHPIHCRPLAAGQQALKVVASRSHRAPELDVVLERMRARFPALELVSMGSSLKICLVAEGVADLYPRLGLTSEWDTAAAHGVLAAAGGSLVNTDFHELRYNERDEILNPHFIAIADPTYPWSELFQ